MAYYDYYYDGNDYRDRRYPEQWMKKIFESGVELGMREAGALTKAGKPFKKRKSPVLAEARREIKALEGSIKSKEATHTKDQEALKTVRAEWATSKRKIRSLKLKNDSLKGRIEKLTRQLADVTVLRENKGVAFGLSARSL